MPGREFSLLRLVLGFLVCVGLVLLWFDAAMYVLVFIPLILALPIDAVLAFELALALLVLYPQAQPDPRARRAGPAVPPGALL